MSVIPFQFFALKFDLNWPLFYVELYKSLD